MGVSDFHKGFVASRGVVLEDVFELSDGVGGEGRVWVCGEIARGEIGGQGLAVAVLAGGVGLAGGDV